MISSMTGFGRCEIAENEKKITIELKSVNHKYMDLNIRMPRRFNMFEQKIRNVLKKDISRGKIDMFINYEDLGGESENIIYNQALAREYYKNLIRIRDEFSAADDISTVSIARFPDVLVVGEQEVDEDQMWAFIARALEGAVSDFKSSREKEGMALKNDIMIKLSEMEEHVAFIEQRMPSLIGDFRAKLTERVQEFIEEGQIDEGRIAAEVVIYSDKIAIDEELVRLGTHIRHMKDVLENGKEIGRNLDFIAQEMNRESNTILSKANDIEVTNRGIELKTCIEKIREQVQNIE